MKAHSSEWKWMQRGVRGGGEGERVSGKVRGTLEVDKNKKEGDSRETRKQIQCGDRGGKGERNGAEDKEHWRKGLPSLQRVACSSHVHMGFLPVLWLPHTSRKQCRRCEWVWEWCKPIKDAFPPHTEYSRERLWVLHHPDQHKVLAMNVRADVITLRQIQLEKEIPEVQIYSGLSLHKQKQQQYKRHCSHTCLRSLCTAGGLKAMSSRG